jgi:hypothetical protein
MNIDIRKFINSNVGRKLFSILLGLGLSAVFRLSCKGKNCVIQSSPDIEKDILNKVYEYDGKCYKYIPTNVPCDPSKKILSYNAKDESIIN